MKVAIYARVSTADGRQDTENQLADLRRFAATQGWQIASEYIDCESGGKPNRAEFRRMFTDASQRRFDVVLFWALDRLTREGALETLQYLNQLSRYGVGYRSFTESYLDSCGMFREALVAILGAIAKQERVRSGRNRGAGHRHPE
jgi:DNA invertase Pin-like site-specific DNA recombinase